MAVNYIPAGCHSVTPYLIAADAPGLIRFVEQVFGAAVVELIEHQDGTIQHAEVRIGDSLVMLSQATAERPAQPVTLYVYVPDVDAAYRHGLAAGGTPLREPADQYYGDRSGGFRDKMGNQWWVATHVRDVSPEELEKLRSAPAPAADTN